MPKAPLPELSQWVTQLTGQPVPRGVGAPIDSTAVRILAILRGQREGETLEAKAKAVESVRLP
jgi:hypothetical protein